MTSLCQDTRTSGTQIKVCSLVCPHISVNKTSHVWTDTPESSTCDLRLAPMLYRTVNRNNTDKDTMKRTVFFGFYSNHRLSSTHTITSSDLFKLLKNILCVLLKNSCIPNLQEWKCIMTLVLKKSSTLWPCNLDKNIWKGKYLTCLWQPQLLGS